MPTLPPVVGTQNALIRSATGGPSLADLGMAGTFLGGIITDLKTSFPYTADEYMDLYMQVAVDVGYGFQMNIAFEFEVWNRDQAAVSGDPRVPKMEMHTLLDGDVMTAITINDSRGFATGTGTAPGTLWADGTKWLVTKADGAMTRQKLRKDSVEMKFRRYAAA